MLSPQNGRYYTIEEREDGRGGLRQRNKIVVVTENEGVTIYNSQAELARVLNVSQGTISHYVKGVYEPKGFRVYSYEDYVAMYGEVNNEQEEIVKPTEEMYFINVLVGLVNRTLVDGATYKIKGYSFKYIKEEDCLKDEFGGLFQRDSYLEIVEVQKPILNEKEIAFLKNILVAFNQVKGIKKCKAIMPGSEFIRIEANDTIDNVDLPCFQQGKYYGNLEQDRLYTIEELGL